MTFRKTETRLSDDEIVQYLKNCILDYRLGECVRGTLDTLPTIVYAGFPCWIFGDGDFMVSCEGVFPLVVINIELKRLGQRGKWRFLLTLTNDDRFEWLSLLFSTKKLGLSSVMRARSVKTFRKYASKRTVILEPINTDILALFLVAYKQISVDIAKFRAEEIVRRIRVHNSKNKGANQ